MYVMEQRPPRSWRPRPPRTSPFLTYPFFSKINNFNKHIQTTCSNFSLYFRWLHCNVCYGAAASTFLEAEAATDLTFSHIWRENYCGTASRDFPWQKQRTRKTREWQTTTTWTKQLWRNPCPDKVSFFLKFSCMFFNLNIFFHFEF